MHISIKIQSPFASKVFNIQFVLQNRNKIKQFLLCFFFCLKFINSEIQQESKYAFHLNAIFFLKKIKH